MAAMALSASFATAVTTISGEVHFDDLLQVFYIIRLVINNNAAYIRRHKLNPVG
jgi:hypothetical protein